jgi:hypothetical protein
VDYLIFSLPRSGSAWLANFLTYGDSFCFHEPLAGGPLERLGRPASIVGVADTGAYLFPVSAPREYALIRNPQDVIDSLAKQGLPALQDWQRFRERTEGLPTFRYEFMFDVGYLRELWIEIVGADFPEARAEQLIEMNVQHDIQTLAARAVGTYGA